MVFLAMHFSEYRKLETDLLGFIHLGEKNWVWSVDALMQLQPASCHFYVAQNTQTKQRSFK